MVEYLQATSALEMHHRVDKSPPHFPSALWLLAQNGTSMGQMARPRQLSLEQGRWMLIMRGNGIVSRVTERASGKSSRGRESVGGWSYGMGGCFGVRRHREAEMPAHASARGQ